MLIHSTTRVSIWLVAAPFLVAQPAQDPLTFFEKTVRPILVNRCYACHSAETKPAGGLRVDDRNGLLTGGDSGPAVIPGDPDQSLLLARIRHKDPKRKMPKEGDPVTDQEQSALAAWIRDGVAWPAEKIPPSLGKPLPSYDRLRSRHWAWQPLSDPKVPAVTRKDWPAAGRAGDIDRFLLAQLELKRLTPVASADRLTLVRRLTFDLTGLPPTPGEVDAFLQDKSPAAYSKLVDRLLQSNRFGERWGRHWLDVARYGESSGPSRNIPYPHAWRYRDYVLDAVNRDVPFDRFLQEQIAGDLLPASNTAERDRLQIATGFLALGPKDVNQRFKERFLMDNVDEKIDTVTRSVLALTVSCARCHDHKFDPVPTADYYALAGIFISTEDATGVRNKMGGSGLDYYDPQRLIRLASYVPTVPPDKVMKLQADVESARKEWEAIRGTPEGLALAANGKPTQQPFRLRYENLQSELLALTDPAEQGFAVHGVREATAIGDTAIRIRGQAERLGPVVPRGFLTAFAVLGSPTVNPRQSGRLELAQWLTSPDNPLTPRVAVNRIWKHLFGEGIVSTVDNFGLTGDRPSHPELLDYLATQFIRGGWSTKSLIRTIVLSRAYRLSAQHSERNRQKDPANRLVWRHSPRRLDAEELRDALLLASGRLELQPPSGSPARELKMIEMPDNGKQSRAIHQKADSSTARSVYLPLLRSVTPSSLEAFDPVTQTLVSGHREATTVPTQALFLMNSTFVQQQSLAMAQSLLNVRTRNDDQRIQLAYRITLGRSATAQEQVRARTFLVEYANAFVPSGETPSPVVLSKPESKTANLAAAGELNDDERTAAARNEERVRAPDSRTAAWMSFAQALFSSAEFRFVR